MNNTDNKKMKIGLNVFADKIAAEDKLTNMVTDSGELIDFAVCHIEAQSMTQNEAFELVHKISSVFKEQNTAFIANFEYQNWHEDCTASDGSCWADKSDGCHRMKLSDEFVKALSKSHGFSGIMYDELEHSIINRNPTIQLSSKFKKILPVFPLSKSKSATEQGELLKKQLKEYADSYKALGAPAFFGEHVYPVLLHMFASCGITPNYKSLKENISNVIYSFAAGAALEYSTPLYNCIDNWFALKNPGHSPNEMYYNLLFAYYAGVSCAYVESVNVMTQDNSLTEHGNKFRQFCKEYQNKERGYDISDYRPEIGIINYDTGYFGQWYPILFKRCLFGNPKIRPDYRSKEIFKVFHILTHGETCKNGLSWCRISPWSIKNKHFSFASLNSTAVFDHVVSKSTLNSLKLCFLCGIHISKETIAAVRHCVRENGMTVVTPKRFVPPEILSKAKGNISHISDGSGKWIVIKKYNGKLKKHIESFIGKKGQMRLTFSDREIIMKINNDRDSFSIIN